MLESSVSSAGPNPTRGTELLDIPQSLELWARYFIVRSLSDFQERWTDVSMKDESFGVTGTTLILEFKEQSSHNSEGPLTLIVYRIFDVPQDYGSR